MRLAAIGVNELHDGSYTVDRTNYFGTYLLLLLKTSALFCFDGEWMELPETTAVLYAPQSVQQYKALGNTYIDDWLHIEADPREIERFGITVNAPLVIKDAERTYTLFRIMKEEFYCHGYKSTLVVSTLLDALLFKLAEASGFQDDRLRSIGQLRREIRRYPMKEWTLADAARMVSLSASRLEALYSREYGISFGADVIRSRLDYAKDLLVSSDLSVKQISARCGYGSESYFSRQFKQYEGMTPLEYRKTRSLL